MLAAAADAIDPCMYLSSLSNRLFIHSHAEGHKSGTLVQQATVD